MSNIYVYIYIYIYIYMVISFVNMLALYLGIHKYVIAVYFQSLA